MKNIWYSDNRDLVKWSVLIHLARINCASRILQIAYFRHDGFAGINIGGETFEIPPEVRAHLRDVNNIESLSSDIRITVFNTVFQIRDDYHTEAIEFIRTYANEKCVVFLDPDTGLEPARPDLAHVLGVELANVWAALKPEDLLVFYQHQTNRNGTPWVEEKRLQFASAIKTTGDAVGIAHGYQLARDVVFYYVSKT